MKREKPPRVTRVNEEPKPKAPTGPGNVEPFKPGEKDFDEKPARPAKPKL
jgi:hypothetical protein